MSFKKTHKAKHSNKSGKNILPFLRKKPSQKKESGILAQKTSFKKIKTPKQEPLLKKKSGQMKPKVSHSASKNSKKTNSKQVIFSQNLTLLSKESITKEVQQSSKKSSHSKAIDLSKLKQEIEQGLRNSKIPQEEAQIQIEKQRAPIKQFGDLAEKNFKQNQLNPEGLKASKGKDLARIVKKKRGKKEYLLTGIEGFDQLLEHGIPRGNAVIVAGGAGSGKTLFCLQSIYNHAKKGRKCLYMSFEESETNLLSHMEDFGWDDKKILKNIKIQRFSPFDITRSVDALLMKAKGELLIDLDPIIFPKGFKPELVILDSLTAVASAFSGKEDSYRIYIEQLFRFFEGVDTTALLITETEQVPKVFSQTGVEEFLADGVVVLYAIKRGNVRENAIEVLKMRGEHHQKKIVALEISENGIVVYPDQEVFGDIGE